MRTGSNKLPASFLNNPLLPTAIVFFTVVIASLVAFDRHQLSKWAIKESLSEARHITSSSAEHVEEYFDAVYTTLHFISLSPDVKLMSENCRPIVRNIFDFHWGKHKLTELYLIKKDFDGTSSPFMEFDPPLRGKDREEVHSLEREAEEYAVQMKHISRFVGDSTLKSLVSGKLQLCVDEKGLVMSVPINLDGEVIGIVSAMMPEARVIAELGGGISRGTAILFNAENEFYSTKELTQDKIDDLELIRQQISTNDSISSEPVMAMNGQAIISRIHTYGDEYWWLVYDFSDEAGGNLSELSDAKYTWGPVLSVLILGLLVAGLIELMRRKREENLINLRQIKKTEESLSKSKKWLSTTLSSLGEAVIAIDNSANISFMNRVAEETTKWSRDEAVGKPISEVFCIHNNNSNNSKTSESVEAVQEDSNISLYNGNFLINRSGLKIPIDISTAPIKSEAGEILGSVIVFRDVTERLETEKSLEQGRNLLQSTIESTADGILVVGQSGEILLTNSLFAKMWNIPNELLQSGDDSKLLKFALDQLVDPDAFIAKVEKLYDSQDSDLDYLNFKDGREIERYSCPLFQNNKVAGRVWSFRDITERKQAEKKLEELTQVPKSNPNGVIIFRTNGTILYQNPSIATLLKELHLSSDEFDKVLPENYPSIIETCIEKKQTHTIIEHSYNERTWLWGFSPASDQKIVYAYATEITERVQSEAQNLKLSAAVSQSENSIVITDNQGIIEYVNPSFEAVSGYSLSEIIGKSNRMFKSGHQGPEFYKKLWSAIRSGKTWAGNIQNVSKSGKLYWERKIISPIHGESSEIIGFLSIGEDITKELEMQQALIESDKLSAIGTLAAGVAHEFKNYLGGIIGNASFALDDIDSDDGLELARETLIKVIDLGEKANDIAMSLLSYSRADPEEFDLEDISAIVKKSINLVEKEMLGSSIEIATYFEKVPKLRLSASKIQQLLLNLLINARHAIIENGVITLAVKATAEAIEVRVGDTGCGIEPDTLSRIFDPFFSTKGVWGKDEAVGTGMGLAICRNIALEHNGDLTVESLRGIGTTFTLSLPYPKDSKDNAPTSDNQRTLSAALFTLETSIISSYFKQACQLNLKILPIDNIDNTGKHLSEIVDFAICDAKFIGKLELYKFTELCKQNDLPFFMIRSGSMEYQLVEIHDSAVANFKEIPNMSSILDKLSLKKQPKALT